MKKNLYLFLVVGAVAIAGGSFYGGMQYQKSRQPASARDFFAQQTGGRVGSFTGGQQAIRRDAANGGMTAGEVVSKDDTSVTLSLQDGGSKIVLLASSTNIGMMAEGTADDLSEGTSVIVTGSSNADGSITASMIQIRPEGDDQMPGGGFMRFGTPPEDAQE